MDGFLRGMVIPHTPRLLAAEPAGPGLASSIARLQELGDEVARLRPDALVVAPATWLTTFHHYVAGAPGPYRTDRALAHALVKAGLSHQVRVILTAEAAPPLDAEVTTALRYLTPAADVPIVPISLCQLADLAETLRWGRAIGAAVRAAGRRVVLAVTEPGPAEAGSARPRALLLGALGTGVPAPAHGSRLAAVTPRPVPTGSR